MYIRETQPYKETEIPPAITIPRKKRCSVCEVIILTNFEHILGTQMNSTWDTIYHILILKPKCYNNAKLKLRLNGVLMRWCFYSQLIYNSHFRISESHLGSKPIKENFYCKSYLLNSYAIMPIFSVPYPQ